MIRFIKKYSALILGFLITFSGFFIVVKYGLVDFPKDAVVGKLVLFFFWWIVFTLILLNISYFNKNKILILKILTLFLLLIIAEFADFSLNIPDNPFTFPLLTIFWLCIFYVLARKFFLKYWVPIILLYSSIIIYFLYARLTTNYSYFDDDTIIGLLVVPIPLLMILWLYDQWNRLVTLKEEKGKAELALLKSQINPHFLFNTLNCLYALIKKDQDLAQEYVLKLSDMIRFTVYEGNKEKVTLADELTYLKNYIDLNVSRYHKKIEIKFTDSIENMERQVAPLFFIILLENAFKHGVEKLTDNAFVHLDLIEDKDSITFEIKNNFETNKENINSGIGLANLKNRLELLYPNKHKFIVSNDKSVYYASLQIILE